MPTNCVPSLGYDSRLAYQCRWVHAEGLVDDGLVVLQRRHALEVDVCGFFECPHLLECILHAMRVFEQEPDSPRQKCRCHFASCCDQRR